MTSDKKTHLISGFSLVEIIITIAIFGLLSGVLMRFFVIAGTAENIAYDRQQTDAIGQTILETFKHSDNVTDFIDTINNGDFNVEVSSETGQIETLVANLTKNWAYTSVGSDNAYYELVITLTSPSESLVTPVTSFDFDLDIETATIVTLTAVEDPSRGLCYMIDDGDGYTEKQNIDINSNEPITLLLNLKGSGTGDVTVKNDLIAASDIIFYDSFKNNKLSVTLNRSEDNEFIVTQIGSSAGPISELSDASTTGVYTIRIAFNKLSTSENLDVLIGKKYGGM